MPLSPSTASVAHRARLSSLFSDLKRVRPRVPFWELAAHRLPTLWTLYRGLLKEAPSEHIRWRIRRYVRDKQHLTSPRETRGQLSRGYRWLEIFRTARRGDAKLQRILERYTSLTAMRREKDRWQKLLLDAKAHREKLLNRPIMTGCALAPSYYNRPIPRLKPQPLHVTGMIIWRKRARLLRQKKIAIYNDWKHLLMYEEKFEDILLENVKQYEGQFEPIFRNHMEEWYGHIDRHMESISESFALDNARASTPYSPEFLDMLRAARREKIANKTRERERERRGEIFNCTVRRMRQGPPVHVAIKMTEEELKNDLISRSPSEAGYVAIVKRKLGSKLRDPEAWKAELGREEEWERLHREVVGIDEENRRRRALADLEESRSAS